MSDQVSVTIRDIPFPERVVELPRLKVDGVPVRVRIRKLAAADVVLAQGDIPEDPTDWAGIDEAERRKRWFRLPARERAKIMRGNRARSEALILAGAVDPSFYIGSKPPQVRPQDVRGEPCSVAAIDALSDDDVETLSIAILRFARGEDEEVAAKIARFRDGEGTGGSGSGGGDSPDRGDATAAP